MKFHVASQYPKKLDAIIVRMYEGEKKLAHTAEQITPSLAKSIETEIAEVGFKAEKGQTLAVRLGSGAPAKRAIVIGLGQPSYELDSFRVTTAALVALIRSLKLRSVATPAPGKKVDAAAAAQANVEGALLADYQFDKYKKSDTPTGPLDYYFVSANPSTTQAIKEGIAVGQVTATATSLARDLVNEPPSSMNPTALAAAAKAVAKRSGLRATVLGPAQMAKLGLEATLAVSRGSDQPPQFIKLQYVPARRKPAAKTPGKARVSATPATPKHIVLVGKGVTFDSGGINLKPSRGGHLEEMKMDMAGSAAVIATMSALKELDVRHKVTAYVGATENLLGGSAYKPGDVVRAYNGKTIEVGNTDAEGRLTLADALSYAVDKEKPDEIIDLATLTGAAIVALGNDIAALFSNNDGLAERFEAAAKPSGEPLWRLPLPEDYNEQIKAPIADLHNTGSGSAGTITAALFLQNFVGKTAWVHLDIAGPAFTEKDAGYRKRGGTGYGVRLLLEYLRAG